MSKGVKLLRSLDITNRKGRGFYTLRHVFRTVADETLDRPAVDLVMGHHDPSMGGRYREHLADERLRRVADHVHAWLLGPAKPGNKETPRLKLHVVEDEGAA